MSYRTQQHQDDSLFGDSLSSPEQPPLKALVGAFPPDHANNSLAAQRAWTRLRSKALTPKHVSDLVTTERDRHEFLTGMQLLRFDGERARPGVSIQPQQLVIADMLAAGHQRNAILAPRRVSKSTSPIAVALGRAAYRDDYRVGIFTATSGKAGRSRFLKDVAAPIERLYPDKRTRPCRVSRVAGMEGVIFPEAGGVYWLSSIDDITGEAFDMLLIDEAGKPNDPTFVAEVMAAAEPTTDTRPDSQIVVLGTAGEFREGNLLWDALELGRKGIGGIVEYAAPDGVTDEQLASWEPTDDNPDGRVRELVEITHPGVGGLTTIATMHSRFQGMNNPEKFAREYLGIFGTMGESTGLLNLTKWANAGSGADMPAPPPNFQFAYAAHPDQTCGSVVAVWRDDDGRVHIQMLEHKTGIEWLAPTAAKIARKFSRPVVYDAGAQVAALVAEQLHRARPRPRLDPQTFPEVKKAHSSLFDEIERENVTHYRQPELDNAARQVVKRTIGVTGWLFGRGKDFGLDITPLEAAAMALLAYDQQPTPGGVVSRVRT